MNTQTIPFTVVGGHVLLEVDGVTTFLDTGSQVSFGSVRSLPILGTDYPIRSSLDGGIKVADVRDGLKKYAQVPKDFDFQALLGLDLLAGTRVALNWKFSRMTIARNPKATLSLLKAELPPIPHGTLMVGRSAVRAILDTGAWVSYLHPDLTVGLRRVGRMTDYNPILGGFSTALVRARLGFTRWSGVLPVGVATSGLVGMLNRLGVHAIVGTDVLAKSAVTRINLGGA